MCSVLTSLFLAESPRSGKLNMQTFQRSYFSSALYDVFFVAVTVWQEGLSGLAFIACRKIQLLGR